MIDEQEKLSPDLQSLVESEVKRLVQVCIFKFCLWLIVSDLIDSLHPLKACFMGVFRENAARQSFLSTLIDRLSARAPLSAQSE